MDPTVKDTPSVSPVTSGGIVKRTLKLFKNSWKSLNKIQKYQMIGVLALILGLPTILGSVYAVKLYRSGAASPPDVTPVISPSPIASSTPVSTPVGPYTPKPSTTPIPTPVAVVPLTIQESFTGIGAIDSTKWGWSGDSGSSVSLQNNELSVSVPLGSNNEGGDNAVVFPYVNSKIPTITGNFDVSVDLLGVSTTNGYEELKLARVGSMSIRRNKVGSTETLEVWTSPDNVPADSTKNVSRTIQLNSPQRVRLVRTGNEIIAYYYDGTNSTYVTIFDTQYAPLNGDGNLPTLVTGNNASDYPATSAVFDNYSATANMLVSSTPIPVAGLSCGAVCGSSNKGCAAGLTCYQQPMPSCPPGKLCPQVMPAPVCRNASCVSSSSCICPTPTPTLKPTVKPTAKPIPTVRPTPVPTPKPVSVCRLRIFGICLISQAE